MLACGCLDLQGSPDCYFDSGAERVTKSIISYRTGRPKLRNWSSMLAFRLVYCCFCVSSCDIPGDICWASGCYTVHAAGYTHSPHVSKQAMRSQFFKITLFCSFRHVYTPFMLLNCKRSVHDMQSPILHPHRRPLRLSSPLRYWTAYLGAEATYP